MRTYSVSETERKRIAFSSFHLISFAKSKDNKNSMDVNTITRTEWQSEREREPNKNKREIEATHYHHGTLFRRKSFEKRTLKINRRAEQPRRHRHKTTAQIHGTQSQHRSQVIIKKDDKRRTGNIFSSLGSLARFFFACFFIFFFYNFCFHCFRRRFFSYSFDAARKEKNWSRARLYSERQLLINELWFIIIRHYTFSVNSSVSSISSTNPLNEHSLLVSPFLKIPKCLSQIPKCQILIT